LRKKLRIKLFNVKAGAINSRAKMIVVGYNNKVNGSYVERLGVFYFEHDVHMVLIDIKRLSYWLLKGVKMKSKVSSVLGILAQAEAEGRKTYVR